MGSAAGGSGAGSGGGAVSGGSGGGGVGAQKRRASYGFNNLTRSTIKRPRYADVGMHECVRKQSICCVFSMIYVRVQPHKTP